MNIYLIRHGEKADDDKNHELIELTAKGFRQADLLGLRLKRYSIDKIYASSMKRAIQTAEGINRHLGVEIIIRPELQEINMGACNIGGWANLEKNYPEFIREHEKHEKDLRYPPDGENGGDVWNRASKIIEEIAHSNLENVAVVTHGGVIRATICGLLKISQTRRFYMGNPPQNCSISVIKYDRTNNEFILHSFNDYAHLEA